MTEADETVAREKRTVPKVVLGLAAVAVIGPLFLLRRLYTRTAKLEHVKLSSGAPPPIRRPGTFAPIAATSKSSTGHVAAAATSAELVKPSIAWSSFGHGGEEDDDYGVPPPRMSNEPEGGDQLSNAFDAFKAISIATAFVGLSAAGIFWGVKSWMGVKTMDEFAQRMRTIMSGNMPSLDERLDDSVVASAGSAESEGLRWSWAAAQQRLATAYEEGGTSKWSEQLALESEAEAQLELAKKKAAVQQHQQRQQNESRK